MTRTRLAVDGMTCDSCGAAVRGALELPGVRQIAVDLETGIVDVAHTESVTVEVMVGAIRDTGYEAREAQSE
jgi:copper chaperone